MDSRYYRSTSPRRHVNPARSSTGTFSDPYYDPAYYNRASSPRTSGERIAGSHHQPLYSPTTSSALRTSNLKYDSYTGRPRRNTEDRLARPNSSTSAVPALPIRTPYSNLDRPSSPLTKPFDTRGDTYITQGPSRREHKKIYSVDDGSHTAQLIAEKDILESKRHRDSTGGYSVTSGGRSYHNNSKPPPRLADVGDESYSYTDPASMYRDTEPAWRRPRTGSIERGARPSSMIVDRPARNSARELGPPPSTRGFEKLINSIPRIHGRSSSIDRPRDTPKYDPYADVAPARTSSTRHHAPAVHQEPPRAEPRDNRRDSYGDDYDRRPREAENRRHSTIDRFEDREIAARGFGIAPVHPSLAQDHHAVDRQLTRNAPEVSRPRQEEVASQYYAPERAEARMPDPHVSRERAAPAPAYPNNAPAYPTSTSSYPSTAPAYPNSTSTYPSTAPAYPNPVEERPREREESRRGAVPIAAGAVAGVAATLGAAGLVKSRERERERERESDRDSSGERERRKQWDERDRRDRYEDRRERVPDERRERPEERREKPEERREKPEERREEKRGRRPEERHESPPATPAKTYAPPGAYPSPPDTDRKVREVRHEDEPRSKPARKALSPEGSGDERPRHYVNPEAERRNDTVPQEAAIDPDEEYRRRVQQEAERTGRGQRDRDSDSERERERDRQRRKEERSRSRAREERSREERPREERPQERPRERSRDERSSSLYDSNLVQEPGSIDRSAVEQPSKAVQIVEPTRDSPPPIKSILRKPTEKFPEHPEPIREGVAPHKDSLKGKDIPVGARWTRIDRKLVNPEALEQAKERFEERADCVIVLRVLTKEEIQKLADRTKRIRDAREDEYDHRDRRSNRSHRDDEERDRDRRRRYDEDDYSDRDDTLRDRERERERERERDRPRMLEPAR